MTNQVALAPDKLQSRQDRFMSLALPVRLGELAESLAFARSTAEHSGHPKYLERTLRDCLNYIDWTSAEVAACTQIELAELRSRLTGWLGDAQAIWDDPAGLATLKAALTEWSQKILARSGLAGYDNWQVEFDYPPGIRTAAEVLV